MYYARRLRPSAPSVLILAISLAAPGGAPALPTTRARAPTQEAFCATSTSLRSVLSLKTSIGLFMVCFLLASSRFSVRVSCGHVTVMNVIWALSRPQ